MVLTKKLSKMNTKNCGEEAKKRYGLELIGDCFKRLLKDRSEQPFFGIRQQLASGHLPNLAQHLEAMVAKKRNKVFL